jgi:hypothetical protein
MNAKKWNFDYFRKIRYHMNMNAPNEPFAFIEWKSTGEISTLDIVTLYSSRLEALDSIELKEALWKLLQIIQERMRVGDLDKVVSAIHTITFDYWFYSGVTQNDRRICSKLYTDLLAEYDRLFLIIFPEEFRRRADQVLKKPPK